MIKFFKNLFKRKHKKVMHTCQFYPIAIKGGLEVHAFCAGCGSSHKITDYYH